MHGNIRKIVIYAILEKCYICHNQKNEAPQIINIGDSSLYTAW